MNEGVLHWFLHHSELWGIYVALAIVGVSVFGDRRHVTWVASHGLALLIGVVIIIAAQDLRRHYWAAHHGAWLDRVCAPMIGADPDSAAHGSTKP